MDSPEINPSIKVAELLTCEELMLSIQAGHDGLKNEITYSKVQKPGLALAGFTSYMKSGRIQIIGLSENEFLQRLPEKKKLEVIHEFFEARPSCIVLSKDVSSPALFIELANHYSIPLLASQNPTSILIERMTNYLSEKLAPVKSVHGDLMSIFGVGTLITGESGVGKSESALDLVVRGHRLIADDVVVIKKLSNISLVGHAMPKIQNHMELRGIGIINIREMFGISATSESAKIELVIDLARWKHDEEYDRLGVDSYTCPILSVEVPARKIPVAPGRNIAILIEVAVKDLLLKREGIDSPERLLADIAKMMNKNDSS